MGRGRAGLAAIASTAAFVGFLATLQGIMMWLSFIPEGSSCDL
jgi:biopolymer transport protein ExbB/TolQ